MKSTKPAHLMVLGALGVVFGDIGTSPLYTLRECLKASGGTSPEAIFGILSLMAWSIFLVVTLKYVFFVMKADNQGEGGILALMALVSDAGPSKWRYSLILLGLFGAAMFYGDSMVTPAISVLSAVEGLKILNPALAPYVIAISLAILIPLFLFQKKGTAVIGAYFGPAMVAWFATLTVLGVYQISKNPTILMAFSPTYALSFILKAPHVAFAVLAAVFLAVTGGEALYADMGHFGRKPIQKAWLYAVFPSLLLNYFGQGALMLSTPSALESPFFGMAPTWALAPLVILATVATVIASQAVITGAFSMTQQGITLGCLPRLAVVHTSNHEIGQIYVPFVNRMLLLAVVFLVVFFKSSDDLAAAYGIAVASTMLLTTVFMLLVTRFIWKWSILKSASITGALLAIDVIFVSTNLGKVAEGGWFPLLAGVVLFTLMTTWKRGRALVLQNIKEQNLPLKSFLDSLYASKHRPQRVSGTAVFLNSVNDVTPTSFMHNLKHNHVLHENNIFLTVQSAKVPHVRNDQRLMVEDLGHHCYAVVGMIGFKESVSIPKLLALLQGMVGSWNYEESTTSFFLNRETVLTSGSANGMAAWRQKIFSFLQRNASRAADYFGLPPNRVIELGSQISI